MTEVKYDMVNGYEMSVEYDDYGITKITRELFESLIEKQMPKKPKCYEDKFIHCPSCGIGFGYKWECYPTKVNDYSHIPYCYGCGQKIDWGNEDDRAD